MRNFAIARSLLLVALMLSGARGVHAQVNPETGDVEAEAQAEGSADTERPAQVSVQTSTPTTLSVDPNAETTELVADDHSSVVGTFGVGFFGVATLPIGGGAAGAPATVSAPTVGVRYWLSDLLGVEAALGLGLVSEDNGGGNETSAFGFALHGGVPLALAHSGHFVFEVVPQLNFGIASGSVTTPAGAGMSSTTDLSGLLFELGGKIGAEIHFGFIDIPQLSLQGSLGFMIRHEGRSVQPPNPAPEQDSSRTVIGTGVDGEPWDIFTGALTAIYYFNG